jgi:TIR domain
MTSKTYDLFVSYSHLQADLVTRLAGQLRRNQVKVWFDGWEMQPGDFLRDRISAGIEQSRCLLVVVSRDALTSNWVKYELNCGITAEIEHAGVRVIPALAPEMEHELLPIDLRAKYYLDLRTPEMTKESVSRLVGYLNPYRYRLMERRTEAKLAIREGPQTPIALREYLFGRHTYELGPSVELAAISEPFSSWL